MVKKIKKTKRKIIKKAKRKTFFKPNKKITNYEFIHRDFDKDGTPNIDDTFPFNPKINKPLDLDSKLSQEFKRIRAFANSHKKALQFVERKLIKLLANDKRVFVNSRLKTLPSIINKLNRKHLTSIRDTAGILIEADNKIALQLALNRIKKSGLTIIKSENFYSKKNKRPYYKAIHFDLTKFHKPIELQIKTIRQGNLHATMHKGHKTGRDTGPYTRPQAIRRARLFDLFDSRKPPLKRKLIRKRAKKNG